MVKLYYVSRYFYQQHKFSLYFHCVFFYFGCSERIIFGRLLQNFKTPFRSTFCYIQQFISFTNWLISPRKLLNYLLSVFRLGTSLECQPLTADFCRPHTRLAPTIVCYFKYPKLHRTLNAF